MLNQKKVEIFIVKFRKPLAKQFLEVDLNNNLIHKNFIIIIQRKIIHI